MKTLKNKKVKIKELDYSEKFIASDHINKLYLNQYEMAEKINEIIKSLTPTS